MAHGRRPVVVGGWVFRGGWMTWGRTNLPTKMVVVFFGPFSERPVYFLEFFLFFVFGEGRKICRKIDRIMIYHDEMLESYWPR